MVVYDQGHWPRSYKIKVPKESEQWRYAHFLTYSDSKILKLIQNQHYASAKTKPDSISF